MSTISYSQLIRESIESEQQYIETEIRGAVAVVRMNHPERFNALTPALCYQLHQNLRAMVDHLDVRVIILTGTDPAFCAGGDLEFILRGEQSIRQGPNGTTPIWRWIRNQFGGIARLLTQSDKYFISAINGPAAGVGLAFAFASDYLIASERAELVLAFGKIGLIPEVGTNWHLTHKLGYHKALELFIQGGRLKSDTALDLGLVNRVVSHASLLDEAQAWAQRVIDLPDSLTAMAKAQMRKCSDMSWEQAIVMEEFAEPNCFTTEAHRDAVRKLLTQNQ